jgi:hypothetical protein
MRKYPTGIQPLVDVVLRSKSAMDAYIASHGIYGLDESTAKWFKDTFTTGRGNASIVEGFHTFYKEVRSGRYLMEGEMERIKEIIKEELLKEAIEDYISAVRNFDWAYAMSDSPDKYSNGQTQERKIKDIYNRLPDNEKRQAAIWFRDYFIEKGMWAGSTVSQRVTRWDPSIDFDPDKFNGVQYWG